jgi:hypothetical protein
MTCECIICGKSGPIETMGRNSEGDWMHVSCRRAEQEYTLKVLLAAKAAREAKAARQSEGQKS